MSANRDSEPTRTGHPADKLEQALVAAFRESALPGENTGFDKKACEEAARYTLLCAQERQGSEASLLLESVSISQNHRHLRLAIVNDDMPFLVDSVCATIGGFGLTIERLIHPVVAVRRDAKGQLVEIAEQATSGDKCESIIYIELDEIADRAGRKCRCATRRGRGDLAALVPRPEPYIAGP